MENIQPNHFDNDNNSNSEDNNNIPVKKKTPTKKPPTKKSPKKNATNKMSKKRKKEDKEEMVFIGGPSNLELCQLNLQLFKKLVPNLMINLDHVGFQDNVVENNEMVNSMNNPNINSDDNNNNNNNNNNNVIILNPNAIKNNNTMINNNNGNGQNNNHVIIHNNNNIPNQQVKNMFTPKIPAPKKKTTKTNNAKKKKPNPKIPPSNQNNLNVVNITKNIGNPTMIQNNNNLNNANISLNNNNHLIKNYPINNQNNGNNNNNNNMTHNHKMGIPNNFQHNVVINNNYTPIIVQNPDLIPHLSSIPQLNHPIILHQPNYPQYQQHQQQQQQQHQHQHQQQPNNNFISHFNLKMFNNNDMRNPNFIKIPEKNIDSLSFFLLIKCLNYLDLNNILEARIVNKQFHKAAMETTVWETLHLDTLPSMLVSSVEFNREFIWNRICMWPLKRVKKIIFRSEMIDLSIIFSNYIKRLAMVLGNNNVTNCIFPNAIELVEVPRTTQESSSNFQSILRCVDLGKLQKLKLQLTINSDSLERMLGIFISLKSLRVSNVSGNIEEIYNLLYNQAHLSHVHFGKEVLLEPSLMTRMRCLESMTWYWDGQQSELVALSNLVNLKCVHLHFKEFQEHTNDQVQMVSPYYLNNLKKLHLINEGECLKYPIIIQSTNLKQLRFINSTSYEKWKKLFNQSSDIFSINSLESMKETEIMMQIYKENYFKTISYVQTPNLTRLLISSVVFNDQMLEMVLKKLPCLTELDLQYTFNEKMHIVSHKLKILKLESLSRLSSLSLECPSLSTLNFFGKFQNSFHLGITSWAMREFVFNLSEKDKESIKTNSNNNLYHMNITDSNENIFVNVFQNEILHENTLTNIKLNCPNLAEFSCKSNTLELDQLDSLVFCGNTNNLKRISLNLGKNVWREKISKKFTFNYPCVSSASFSCLLPPKPVSNEDNENEENNVNKEELTTLTSIEELAFFKYPLKMDSLVNLTLSNFQIRQKWIQSNFYNNSKLTELILDNINVDTVTLLFVKEIFRSLRVLKLRKLVNTHSLSVRLPTLKHLTVSDCDMFRTFNQFECESLETLFFYNCPSADNLELSMWRNFHSLKILALGGIRINMFSVENFPVVFTTLKYIHYFPLLTKESNDLDSQGFFEIILSLNKGYFITFSEICDPWLTN